MNKILTIIIPTYNMEKYIRRCLDSLIIDEEGMKQLEVLVINDGSFINRGLKEAKGKYVKENNVLFTMWLVTGESANYNYLEERRAA